MGRTDQGDGDAANHETLRRWLAGQDAALEEWLDGRVRPIRRKPRSLATA